MNEAQRVEHGRQAAQALEFLEAAFADVKASYLLRMGEVMGSEPWHTDKIKALVTAHRIAVEVERHIQGAVNDGKLAAAEIKRLETIGSMSEARKRVLGYHVDQT